MFKYPIKRVITQTIGKSPKKQSTKTVRGCSQIDVKRIVQNSIFIPENHFSKGGRR